MVVQDKKTIFNTLIFADCILVGIYLFTNNLPHVPWTIRNWFDLDAEANIPTWFSNIQLFLISLTALFCASKQKEKNLRQAYSLLSAVFLFFSADEIVQIHEKITILLKAISIHSPLPGGHGAWIFVYAAILCICGIVFYRSILAFLSEKEGRTLFLSGCVVYVSGGVLLEIAGYFLLGAQSHYRSFLHLLEVPLEEGFELLGESLLIYAMMFRLDPKRN